MVLERRGRIFAFFFLMILLDMKLKADKILQQRILKCYQVNKNESLLILLI